MLVYTFLLLFALAASSEILNKDYENYLGTKTPYRVVANLNDSQLQFAGNFYNRMPLM